MKKPSGILAVSNPPLAPMITAWIARWRKIPYYVLIYDLYPEALEQAGFTRSDHWLYKRWRKVNPFVFGGAKKVFTLSDSMKKAVAPYLPGRESMMLFFDRLLGTSSVDIRQPLTVENAFVIAHALLFKRGPISLFDKMVDIFISGIDAHARRERGLFQMQGSQMACILCATLLELGNSGAFWFSSSQKNFTTAKSQYRSR